MSREKLGLSDTMAVPSSLSALTSEIDSQLRHMIAADQHIRETATTVVPPSTHLVSTAEEVSEAYLSPPKYFVNKLEGDARLRPLQQSIAGVRERVRKPQSKRLRHEEAAESPLKGKQPQGGVIRPYMSFASGFEAVDHMGRVFTQPLPLALQAAELRMRESCVPPRAPKRVIQAPLRQRTDGLEGHAPAGIQILRWAPPRFGHLLFSADLAGVAKLWRHGKSETEPVATYHAHARHPVKSLHVTSDASVMSTSSTDGTIAMWDVETGQCLHHISTSADPIPVSDHLHHPSGERHTLLAAVDRKLFLYDVRAGGSAVEGSDISAVYFKPQREYVGHMGTILHVSLLGSDGSKLLTTSEDKTLRTWDYEIPIQIKQFADAKMHAISHVLQHPQQPELLAAQSLDNKVLIFQDEGRGRLRRCQHREFQGHSIAGTRCQLSFSRDGTFLSSGDISGHLYIWKWENGEIVKRFAAHQAMLTTHAWHPVDSSRVVTGSWDGAIKEWG